MSAIHLKATFIYSDNQRAANAAISVHETFGSTYNLGNTDGNGVIDKDIRNRKQIKVLRFPLQPWRGTHSVDDPLDHPTFTISFADSFGKNFTTIPFPYDQLNNVHIRLPFQPNYGTFHLRVRIQYLGGEPYSLAVIKVKELAGSTYDLGSPDSNGLLDKDLRNKKSFLDNPVFRIEIRDIGNSSSVYHQPLNLLDLITPNSITIKVPWLKLEDFIPQKDPNPTLRLIPLNANRLIYKWSKYEALEAGCIKENELPTVEIPDPTYFTERAGHRVSIQLNEFEVGQHFPSGRFSDLNNYKLLYPAFVKKPADDINILQDDRAFSLFRVAGPNPRVLKRVEKLPADFAFNSVDHLPPDFGGKPFLDFLNSGAVFLCDYAPLNIDPKKVQSGRFFTAPYALFVQKSLTDFAELVPMAIQIDRKDPTSVVKPGDGSDKWNVAKLMVQVADLNHHEIKSHLWDCHLAMEPFAIAAARQLATNHPIGRLLKIHFRYMIYQNYAARYDPPDPLGKIQHGLVAPNGLVDKLLGTGREGALDILVNGRNDWKFASAGIEKDLAGRGFMDTSHPPKPKIEYPFAEDALSVNNVIANHVNRWVEIYYSNNSEVEGDFELQAFKQEVEDPNKGRLGDLPSLQTKNDLKLFLTQIIFTCTALHSAVNYSQYKYQAFIPNNPAAAWADWHTNPPLTQFLPDIPNSLDSVSLSAELSFYQHDKLGDYHNLLKDTQAKLALKDFKQDLFQLSNLIDSRNQKRVSRNPVELRTIVEYPFLHPNNIANSISI